MTPDERTNAVIASERLVVGLEIHVELSTRSKMFTRAPNPALIGAPESEPNTLIDPVVLGLPGALPVMNRAAVELSLLVGLALGCRIPEVSHWDRKSYFYPDLPKGYQISQYEHPLCAEGELAYPPLDAEGRIDYGADPKLARIVRAHLEEDAGKLLHEAPGGSAIDGSIADWNRAGTPLLEIVTEPDFGSANDAVAFARTLRDICRFLGATDGVMQKGHMRFEPNINLELTLDNGSSVTTPITEVKNLNSFRALRGAIEYERKTQAKRWRETGETFGPGTKSTRGWDDERERTVLQREKEDAHDYRYFPDPDLVPVVVDPAWLTEVRSRLVELPADRARRYTRDHGLNPRSAGQLVEESETCELFELAVETSGGLGKAVANLLLQVGARIANERGVGVHELDISPDQIGAIAKMRDAGEIGSDGADTLFEKLCDSAHADSDAREFAEREGLLVVRDDAALDVWCAEAIAEHPDAADDVRAGKQQAIGRLIGSVMQKSGGSADAKTVRTKIISILTGA